MPGPFVRSLRKMLLQIFLLNNAYDECVADIYIYAVAVAAVYSEAWMQLFWMLFLYNM